MQFFLEFLTKALIYVSIAAVTLPMSTIIFIDDDSLKPNAPRMLLWSMTGGIIVFFITVALIGTGMLPYIFN